MESWDVAVIGGGVVGASIGYGLARRGQKVLVLDEGDTALRASRGNGGLVWVQSKGLGLPAYTALTLRSAGLWPQFRDHLLQETGIDITYDQIGGIQACIGDEELAARTQYVERMLDQSAKDGLRFEMLDRKSVKEIVPEIGPDVTGASYCPLDGSTSPMRLLRALHAGLQLHGADYRPGSQVTDIVREGSAYRIQRQDESFSAGRVVLAAGLGSIPLAPKVGIDLPIRSLKGQAVVTERVSGKQKVLLIQARQTNDGHYLLGATKEEGEQGLATKFEVYGGSAKRAIEILPFLEHVKVLRIWAALRIMTPDSNPIYVESESCPGVYAASCHSGITLAAAHALELGAQLAEGGMPKQLAPFAPTRFDKVS